MDVVLPPPQRTNHPHSNVEDFPRNAIVYGRFEQAERPRAKLRELPQLTRTSMDEALRRPEAEKLIKNDLCRSPVVASVARVARPEAEALRAVRRLRGAYAVIESPSLASDAQVEQLDDGIVDLHDASGTADRSRVRAAQARYCAWIYSGCGRTPMRDMRPAPLSRVSLLRDASCSAAQRLPGSMGNIEILQAAALVGNPETGAGLARLQHVLNANTAALAVLDGTLTTTYKRSNQ